MCMELTIADAASRLGVSVREAQRLAQQGQLQVVRRVGRSLLVEDTSVTQRVRGTRSRGRLWSANTAWAAIELLDRGATDRLTGSARSRLKRRLASITAEDFARLAADRAEVRRMTQTRRRSAALEAALLVSGRSALKDDRIAGRFGLAGEATEHVEGYVRRGTAGEVASRFGLVDDADGEVLLRISNEDAVASHITVALDLVERGDTRQRSAGLTVLRQALAR